MPEHHREHEPTTTEHRRVSDDIIMELLRIVQMIDVKLDNHIREEMDEFRQRMIEHKEQMDKIINVGFDGDPERHRQLHMGVLKRLLSKLRGYK